jgi:hypothetical protein
MYFIELILNKKDVIRRVFIVLHSHKEVQTVDIDYLKYVLDLLPDETGVETYWW